MPRRSDNAYSANGLNQYTAIGTVAPSYDTKGNLTSAGPVTYSYNMLNQLSSVSDTGDRFSYDPTGRMDSILDSGGTAQQAFEHDGAMLVTERGPVSTGSTILRRYVYGPGADEPLVWYEGAGTGTKRYLMADERGSVVAVTDGAGQAVAINTYDEYGNPAAANTGRFQYAGQAWIPELEMYDDKARIYSPALGRFLQTDPTGYANGPNWYAYVGNDPVNNTDPTGLGDCPSTDSPCYNLPSIIYGNGSSTGAGSSTSQSSYADYGGYTYGPSVLGGTDALSAIAENATKNRSSTTTGAALQNSASRDVCEAGNHLEDAADTTGKVSFGFAAGGAALILAGALTAQPEIVVAGVALLDVSGAFGALSGGLQISGGAAQVYGGNSSGYHNVVAGGTSVISGLAVSGFLKAGTPRGWHGSTLQNARSTNRAVGNTIGALQGTAGWFSPRQVICH